MRLWMATIARYVAQKQNAIIILIALLSRADKCMSVCFLSRAAGVDGNIAVREAGPGQLTL